MMLNNIKHKLEKGLLQAENISTATKCSHSTHIHTESAKEPQDPFSHCPTDIVRSSSLV
jgi:hypothetical protein